MYATKPYRDAVQLQRLIMADSSKQSGMQLANLAKAFATLEVLKLRLKMRPAPKAIDVSKAKRVKQASVVPIEEG